MQHYIRTYPENIIMKNKLTYLLFLLFTNLCFSQTDTFYKIIFENEKNFETIKILNGRIPKKFILVDSTVTFYPKSFWLDNIDLKDEKVIKEIENDEHHPFNNVYIFSQKKYNVLFSDDEKEYLSKACKKAKSKKIKITEKKYFTVSSTNKIKGFYFLVSEPVYTSNNKFAFVQVDIKQKGSFLGEKTDDYYGVLKIIFEKDENEIWKQIGNYEHLVL
ncbi:hypothetical protein [Flavobacterium sp. LB3P21]|uniref:hypothetical protein n=1 Tax=Flavobacterium sp. LB3P21 TaxID=3401719 RepID=UPI003AABADCC